MIYSFVVPGKPQGKARPRFDSRRKVTYTPQKTKIYEELVRSSFIVNYKGAVPLEGAIRARIIAFFPIPKSATKSVQEAMADGEIYPTVKPDLDNIVKAVLDALNGYAYKDDAAIVDVSAVKMYSFFPKVLVTLADEKSFDFIGEYVC